MNIYQRLYEELKFPPGRTMSGATKAYRKIKTDYQSNRNDKNFNRLARAFKAVPMNSDREKARSKFDYHLSKSKAKLARDKRRGY